MSAAKNSYSVIQSFVKSPSKLKIVSQRIAKSKLPPMNNIPNGSQHNVLILDSSFNPPHKGHMSIIDNALKHYNAKLEKSIKSKSDAFSTQSSQESGDNATAELPTAVVLMLSMNNADKLHPKPELFDKRLQMIQLLSEHIYKVYNGKVSVLICLTKLAKFTDKYREFKALLSDTENPDANLWSGYSVESLEGIKFPNVAFLVGFDTLIRIFDAKYYKPNSIQDSLGEFMRNCELVCLARDSGSEGDFLNEQESYLVNVNAGNIEGVPASWGPRIAILNPLAAALATENVVGEPEAKSNENEKFLTTISSSEIRNKLGEYYKAKSGDSIDLSARKKSIEEFLSKRVTDEIRNCILDNEFYNN